MTYKAEIIFPGGAGGNWLSGLIYNLEMYRTNSKQVADEFSCFDYVKGSDDVSITHVPTTDDYYILSSDKVFSLFDIMYQKTGLRQVAAEFDNDADRIINIGELSRHYISKDSLYNSKPILLDVEWLYTDPDQFIDVLFDLLNKHNVNYLDNRDYVHREIQNYLATLAWDPTATIGNLDSLVWLGWCLGVIESQGINIPVPQFKGMPAFAFAFELQPYQDMCVEYTKDLIYAKA